MPDARPRLLLFDDARARAWAPFHDSRPVGELLFGCWTLRERAERVFGLPCEAHIVGPALEGWEEPDAPRALAPRPALGSSAAGPVALLSSRCAVRGSVGSWPTTRTRLRVDGRTAGWLIPAGAKLPGEAELLDPTEDEGQAGDDLSDGRDLDGVLLDGPWDLVRLNASAVLRDVTEALPSNEPPVGTHVVGRSTVSLGSDAYVEPGVVLDVRSGPIRLDDGVRVEGPARLVGPLFLGRDTLVFGGQVGSSSIGPVCKIRGEISGSVLVGYTNKAHDGYLGHALLGRWVNLGALTTNSDLKNNYGTVTVWSPGGPVDTGLTKVGCFLGDHVKTGIGTMLNTGTVIGTGSNVFGGAMPPTFVPPFSWGSGADLRDYRLDKFLEVAERAMERRAQRLRPGQRRVLERAWTTSAPLRAETGAR